MRCWYSAAAAPIGSNSWCGTAWAAEALVYNEVAQEWTNLEDRAVRYQPAVAIPDLFGVAAR